MTSVMEMDTGTGPCRRRLLSLSLRCTCSYPYRAGLRGAFHHTVLSLQHGPISSSRGCDRDAAKSMAVFPFFTFNFPAVPFYYTPFTSPFFFFPLVRSLA